MMSVAAPDLADNRYTFNNSHLVAGTGLEVQADRVEVDIARFGMLVLSDEVAGMFVPAVFYRWT